MLRHHCQRNFNEAPNNGPLRLRALKVGAIHSLIDAPRSDATALFVVAHEVSYFIVEPICVD
jgi:hypothetical protein